MLRSCPRFLLVKLSTELGSSDKLSGFEKRCGFEYSGKIRHGQRAAETDHGGPHSTFRQINGSPEIGRVRSTQRRERTFPLLEFL